MMKIDREARTLRSWEKDLLPSEVEALHDHYYLDPAEMLTPGEVLECIVEWNGGIATAYYIKSVISRIYGIEL